MMNIVFTGEFTYPDGMAGTKRIQHFINYLRDHCNTKVLLYNQASSGNAKFIEKGDQEGIPYIILGSGLKLSLSAIYKIPWSLFLCCKYITSFKEKRTSNILYVYNGMTIENILFILYAKLIGYKLIFEYVEDYRLSAGVIRKGIYIKNKTNVFFERFLPILASGIVVISTYLHSKFLRYSKKTPLIHVPITAYINGNSEHRELLSSPEFTIAYSGSFGSKDGIEALISAFKSFSVKFPQSKLLLAGMNKNKTLIEKHLVHPRIKYVGFIQEKDFSSFLMNADILCVTRNKMKYASAGFPFKLGEYLATGRPVITTNISDIEKYLVNYKDAIIVEPENPGQISDALTYLVQNKEEATRIGKNGQEACKKYFNPYTNSEKLYSFLKKASKPLDHL